MFAPSSKLKRSAKGLGVLAALVVAMAFAACGQRPNDGYAPLAATPKITPEEAAKTTPRLKLVQTTLVRTEDAKNEIYRINDVTFGADKDTHIINAEVTVQSSGGKEVIKLAGKIRENGSATLLDLAPRKDRNGESVQRLIAEAYCVDFELCEKIILNVWYKVGKETQKRQFVRDLLDKASQEPAPQMPGAATPVKKAHETPPVKANNDEDDNGDDSVDHGEDSEPDSVPGEFVGAPRNEEYISQLWDRPSVPEPVVDNAVDLGTVTKDLPPAPTLPEAIPAKPAKKLEMFGPFWDPKLKQQADAAALAAKTQADVAAKALAAEKIRLVRAAQQQAAAEAKAKADAQAASEQRARDEAQMRAAVLAQQALDAKMKAEQDAADKAKLAAIADAKARADAKAKLDAQRQFEALKKAQADRAAEDLRQKMLAQRLEAEKQKAATEKARIEAARVKAQEDLQKAKAAKEKADADKAAADAAKAKIDAAAAQAAVKAKADADAAALAKAQAADNDKDDDQGRDKDDGVAIPIPLKKPVQTETDKNLEKAQADKAKKDAADDAADAEGKRVDGDNRLKRIEAKLSPLLELRSGGRALNFYNEGGRLEDSTPLPWSGTGFQRIKKDGTAFYGTGMMISLLMKLTSEFVTKYFPGSKIYIGDVAKKGGGHLLGTKHVSHQNGLDADIAFVGTTSFRKMVKSGAVVSDFDYAKNWQFWRLVQSQQIVKDGQRHSVLVQIYVNPVIKRGLCTWAKSHDLLSNPADADLMRRLRAWDGHTEHFHLRIRCSPYYYGCRDQGEPESGTGC